MANAVTLGKAVETMQSSEERTYSSVFSAHRIMWRSKEPKRRRPSERGQSPARPGYHRPSAHHLRRARAAPLPLRAHPGDGQRGAEIFTAHQTKTPRRRATQDHRMGHSGSGSLPAHGLGNSRSPAATPAQLQSGAIPPPGPARPRACRKGGMDSFPLRGGSFSTDLPLYPFISEVRSD